MEAPGRFLIVVSRREPGLHQYLSRAFAGVRGVEVVIDRRQGDRRKSGALHPDRRRGERRDPTRLQAVTTLGCYLVRPEVAPTAGGPSSPPAAPSPSPPAGSPFSRPPSRHSQRTKPYPFHWPRIGDDAPEK